LISLNIIIKQRDLINEHHLQGQEENEKTKAWFFGEEKKQRRQKNYSPAPKKREKEAYRLSFYAALET